VGSRAWMNAAIDSMTSPSLSELCRLARNPAGAQLRARCRLTRCACRRPCWVAWSLIALELTNKDVGFVYGPLHLRQELIHIPLERAVFALEGANGAGIEVVLKK